MHVYEGAVMAILNPGEYRAGLGQTSERAQQHLALLSFWRNPWTIRVEHEMEATRALPPSDLEQCSSASGRRKFAI